MNVEILDIDEREHGFDVDVEIDGVKKRYGFSNHSKWDKEVKHNDEKIPKWLKHIIKTEKKNKKHKSKDKKKMKGKKFEI